MDAKGLINIASQFIASENGKKLFEKVKGVDFDNVTEALAAQQNKTEDFLSKFQTADIEPLPKPQNKSATSQKTTIYYF